MAWFYPSVRFRESMELSGIDINLLVPLDALLQARSVTQAGRRLGLSPSATSHALGRLRALFDDPLLVRSGRDMVCTPRAEQLRPEVRRLVEELEGLFQREKPFDPRTLVRRFHVGTTDHLELALLEPLSRILSEQAPRVVVHDYPVSLNVLNELRDGRMDLAFSAFQEPPEEFSRELVIEDRFVTVMRKGHPASLGPFTLERFLSLDHITVSPVGARSAVGSMDEALSARGVSRRIVMSLATFLPAPFLVAGSDVVLTVSKHFVDALPAMLDLHVVETPLPLPGPRISLVWHKRLDNDPGHRWFRETLAQLCRRKAGAESNPTPDDRRDRRREARRSA